MSIIEEITIDLSYVYEYYTNLHIQTTCKNASRSELASRARAARAPIIPSRAVVI